MTRWTSNHPGQSEPDSEPCLQQQRRGDPGCSHGACEDATGREEGRRLGGISATPGLTQGEDPPVTGTLWHPGLPGGARDRTGTELLEVDGGSTGHRLLPRL